MSSEPSPGTLRALIHEVESAFAGAGLFYGHGTDNPADEALYLVCGTLGIVPAECGQSLDRAPSGDDIERVRALVRRRIDERIPVAYLVNEAWFAGIPFHVDTRALIPRSPIAELILDRFAPWVDETAVESILDVGTGCGCIAVACALAFPHANVDAIDDSTAALDIARRNVKRHGVGDRVRCLHSDLFGAVAGRRYDLIVANPPYVPQSSYGNLPPEYRHEPAAGLKGGEDGLDVVRPLLAGAGAHLKDDGVLIVEVGEVHEHLQEAYPRVPFVWLDLERGGEGVFLLNARDVHRHVL